MMQIASRMNRLGTETAFEVLAEVNKLKAKGKDIISFAIGEPDFDTPSNIIEAGSKALHEGYTHYGPSAGLMPFRESIARYISRTRGIEVSSEEVVVTPGAKPIIFFSILSCINEGDEVIYPNPGFPIYESVINFVGAKAVPLPFKINYNKFSSESNWWNFDKVGFRSNSSLSNRKGYLGILRRDLL